MNEFIVSIPTLQSINPNKKYIDIKKSIFKIIKKKFNNIKSQLIILEKKCVRKYSWYIERTRVFSNSHIH